MLKEYIWTNTKKNRYYKIRVHKDMLNDTVLTFTWGGKNNRKGNHKHLVVSSEQEIEKQISEMMKRRCNRGYDFIVQ